MHKMQIELEPEMMKKMQRLRGETNETYRSMVRRGLSMILSPPVVEEFDYED